MKIPEINLFDRIDVTRRPYIPEIDRVVYCGSTNSKTTITLVAGASKSGDEFLLACGCSLVLHISEEGRLKQKVYRFLSKKICDGDKHYLNRPA